MPITLTEVLPCEILGLVLAQLSVKEEKKAKAKAQPSASRES